MVTTKSWYVVCKVSEALMRLLRPSFFVLLIESGVVSSCTRRIHINYLSGSQVVVELRIPIMLLELKRRIDI